MSTNIIKSPDLLATTPSDERFLKLIDKLHRRCYRKGFAYMSESQFYKLWWNGPSNAAFMERNRTHIYTSIAEKSPKPIYIVGVCAKVTKLPGSLKEALVYIPCFRKLIGFVVVNRTDGWLYVADAQFHGQKLCGGVEHRTRRTNAVRPLLADGPSAQLETQPQLMLTK